MRSIILSSAFSCLVVTCLVMTGASLGFAQPDLTPAQQKIKAALELGYRSEANRERDANRAPVKAMGFCRLQDDMKVLEFGPGSGWYTELLGPALKEKGELHIAYKGAWMTKLDGLLALEPLSKVKKLPIDIGWNAEKRKFDVGSLDFGMTDADMALNIREYHNFDADGAAKLNAAVFAALRPGGLYCVIDHSRRHMETDNSENRRRADPVTTILQVQAAGFRLIDATDLFFKPDDELRYEVGRKTVTGNTDRFSLLFQKPSL
jgi:predicted methyltransferase